MSSALKLRWLFSIVHPALPYAGFFPWIGLHLLSGVD